MTDGQVTEYLLEQVVQIRSVCQRIKVRRVLFGSCLQIEAVIIRVVEEVALDPERLAVHLLPLGPGVDVDFDVARLQQIGCPRCARRAWGRRLAECSGLRDKPIWPQSIKRLLAVG